MNKKQYKICQWKNDGFYYYGIHSSIWWKMVLDSHDKASWRREFASILEARILSFHKQDPSSTELVGAWGRPLLENIYKGPSYSLYHKLIKGCEKHYRVQSGEINRLPQYNPDLHREQHHKYECNQRGKFYSRYRDCAS